jgi:hypothetical protein
MKTKTLVSLIFVTLVAAPLVLWAGAPPIPKTPAAVSDVLYARPFTLEKSYDFAWRAEKPKVESGYLLVLKVNQDLVYPRQVAEPVLYVGDQTAERVNVGYESGCVIAIVPGKIDLEKTPIWFGAPELPERVTAAKIAQERASAEAAKIKPLAADRVKAAVAKGGDTAKLADYDALRRQAAQLIKTYSPSETSLADGILAPRVSP